MTNDVEHLLGGTHIFFVCGKYLLRSVSNFLFSCFVSSLLRVLALASDCIGLREEGMENDF